MPLLGTILGWTGFGLAARCWQLAIQKRNMFDNLGGHAISMGFWGTAGYFYYNADQRVLELLEQKKELLRQSRAQLSSASSEEEEE